MPSPKLTVAHVTNSLGQIEIWIAAIRDALAGLPAQTPLPMPPQANPLSAPIFVQKDCPPPPRHRRPKKPKKKLAKKK